MIKLKEDFEIENDTLAKRNMLIAAKRRGLIRKRKQA